MVQEMFYSLIIKGYFNFASPVLKISAKYPFIRRLYALTICAYYTQKTKKTLTK